MSAKFDRRRTGRRSLRLDGYDYSLSGAYFVTICTAHRICSLGSVVSEEFYPSSAGQIVHNVWLSLEQRFPMVSLDLFVVMPDHLHGILLLTHSPGRETTPKLGTVIQTFKAASARLVRQTGVPDFAWQADYYDHIVRNEHELARIRDYIAANPSRWHEDIENPQGTPVPHANGEDWRR